jgi:hypothetical protein
VLNQLKINKKMIKLHYFEHKEVKIVNFTTITELVQYLNPLKDKKYIWLATEDGENGEIMVTESISKLIAAIKAEVFNLSWVSNPNFFIQQYDSYEDAYAVALGMREANPRCYCKES